MSKTVFTIELPEPKVRKKQAPPARAHRDKNAYRRKAKHKKDWRDQSGGDSPQAPVTRGLFLALRPPPVISR